MDYSKDEAILLQKMYRHKIVHLSAPKAALLYNEKIISWSHNEMAPEKHLSIVDSSGDIDIYGFGNIHYDRGRIVSIWRLREQITDSVIRPMNGYLAQLEANTDLQNKFVTAINQIFDPVVID